MSLDLTLTPLYRINGQESASVPGLLAIMPPRKTARGREQDRLLVYLLLTGNATFSTAEYTQLAEGAAIQFYQSAGPLTSAMRAAAEAINKSLLERNVASSGRGQYAIGWLTLAALRDSNCTLLLSGPMHAFILGQEARHIFEPTLSGKGLGVSQAATHYFTQCSLEANDRLLFTGKVPSAWDSTLGVVTHATLEATRRRLLTLTNEDLHAVLMQATQGTGTLNILKVAVEARPAAKPTPPPPTPTVELPPAKATESTPEPDPEYYPAHVPQPSAYAIAPQPEEPAPAASANSSARRTSADEFPSSIPRAKPKPETVDIPAIVDEPKEEETPPVKVRRTRTPSAPREPSQWMRQTAKAIINGIQAWRRGNERLNEGTRNFLPRLLPGNEAGESKAIPAYAMNFMAIAIPLIVCTIGVFMYLRFGRSIQYDNYLNHAKATSQQAAGLTDPIMQRDAWKSVLLDVDKAESYRKTDETKTLRTEAEARLDQLLGIVRLQFQPAFSSGLGIEISRMAATESDLYLLDATTGEVLRAQISEGHNLVRDNTFDCKPGQYGGYQVGHLVDILALPILNSIKATVLGVDATGNLLYCAPNQVPQAIPLPPPDTNWGHVTGMTLDAGNLYVLDAPSSAVWVYTGKDSTFVDRPYFFFGEQIPEIQDSIDLAVSGDDLYLLHGDGHLSFCSYSRIGTVPTRCQDPAMLVNPYAAYKDTDLFGQAHITQMIYTSPPDSTILLLGADNQVVLRFTPRSLELQNQFSPAIDDAHPLPTGPIGAMTTGPNHVLYLAIRDQVYFTNNMP